MSDSPDLQPRCTRCGFLLTADEPRLQDDFGYLHPRCATDEDVIA